VVPVDGVTVSQDCDGNSAIDVLPPVADTVMLCDTAEPPASAEKVNEDELTDIVWALAAPAASNKRAIREKFNVFKENLHSLGNSGRNAPALTEARGVPPHIASLRL
jgi:hypothetical protein